VAVDDPKALQPFVGLIASELNVKFVVGVTPAAFVKANPVEQRLTVNSRAAGPRIGKQVQHAIAGAKSGDWSETRDGVVAGGVPLEPGEFELETVIGGDGPDAVVASVLRGVNGTAGGFVLLDTTITPALEREGYARDLVRAVQDARKEAGLSVADRIHLTLTVPEDRVSAVDEHHAFIGRETLATAFDVVAGDTQAIEVRKR